MKPGGDAALALGVAHVLVAEDLVDRDFVPEQTDLPLLVREDTRRFLRAVDLEEGGERGRAVPARPARRGVVPAPTREPRARGAAARRSRAASRRRCATARRSACARSSSCCASSSPSYTPETRRGALRHAGAADPRPRPPPRARQGRVDGDDQQLREVLPRQPDRTRAGAGVRAHRELRQEGQRLRRLPVPGARRARGLRALDVRPAGAHAASRALGWSTRLRLRLRRVTPTR